MVVTTDRAKKAVTVVTAQDENDLTGIDAVVTSDHEKDTFSIAVKVTSAQVAQLASDITNAPEEVAAIVEQVVSAAIRKAIALRDANMAADQAQLNLFDQNEPE